MAKSPVELEREGLTLKRAGKFKEAIDCFIELNERFPTWEHGLGQYQIAECYAEIGDFSNAARHYEAALDIEPCNSIWLAGYASFLYLHGDPKQSFDLHLKMIELERKGADSAWVNNCITAMITLGKRLQLSEAEVRSLAAKALNGSGGSK